MNPYNYVREACKTGKSLLSLCCGIGLELKKLPTTDIVAVDIYQPYLDELKHRSDARTVCSDALKYLEKQPSKSVDVISIIDGIEHMEKDIGLKVIDQMKRVAREQILLFTPEGHTENHPENTWGIPGGDKYQEHLSGWEIKELTDLGFEVLEKVGNISPHGERYNAVMYRCSL